MLTWSFIQINISAGSQIWKNMAVNTNWSKIKVQGEYENGNAQLAHKMREFWNKREGRGELRLRVDGWGSLGFCQNNTCLFESYRD